MTDHELDRALAAAINVDHSPDLLARVRAHVAAQPVGPPRHVRLFVLAGAAYVAAALIAAIVTWPVAQPVLPERPRLTVFDRVPPAIVPPRPAPTDRGPRIAARGPRMPQVLISQEDARTVDLLVAIARERRAVEQLPADTASKTTAVTLPGIDIPRVSIEPLAEITRPEGEHP
jgi:hypothetical protein